MRFFVIVSAALASVAAASQATLERAKCKPATYRCEPSNRAWDVCNTRGDWVFAGRCPPGTSCKFNKQNGSPYCLPVRHNEVEDGQVEI